jgi:hypothetical protein
VGAQVLTMGERVSPVGAQACRLVAWFGKLMPTKTEKWGKVVKFAGIRPE